MFPSLMNHATMTAIPNRRSRLAQRRESGVVVMYLVTAAFGVPLGGS
jgi:hypothetical protein